MKSLTLLLALLVTAFIPITQSSFYDYDASVEEEIITIDNIENEIPAHLPVTPCSESATKASDTCSCIAAGSCNYDPTSEGCRIEFCSGHIETSPGKYSPDNITTIEQPCPEEN